MSKGAKERAVESGRRIALEILRKPGMLTSGQFAARLGVTPGEVDELAAKKRVARLSLEGVTRYPAAQIGRDGRLLALLPEMIDNPRWSNWDLPWFLGERLPELGGVTGADWIQDQPRDRALWGIRAVLQGPE